MSESKFKPEDMPILDLDTSGTSVYEASRFLDSPETISAYLAQSMKSQDPQVLMKALAEVVKAQGVNKVAEAAGVNRESLYKTLKGGSKTRYETVQKLMLALGVELTVQPLAVNQAARAKPAAVGKP
ncbi:addiction module antidote protein [Pseudomonas sp. O64]|uniref:addiction module antidote protein n=1 Tax=Pseudomonas TaxID=286 RepID=UPI000B9FB8B5|nr:MULTISPECIES: addiction module antidote protein [unclassified Pseudomonas]MCV2226243.1 putative addiction module antidote protein [Pseudomonas sp. AU10]OZO01535.1 putative addiction module antidote protein [Pseudomonas sp. IB20]UNM18147.1 putative addiction module antidote protein [Pseudomonas sp. ArH3a]UXZ20926.1 putative addiction module antidote protein [Pseudomonas sp. YeP6b]